MSRLVNYLKEKHAFYAFLFLLLILLPVALVFTAWLTDFQWWSSEAWRNRRVAAAKEDDDDWFRHVKQNLDNSRCPARAGQQLRDYWKCLWATSITAQGIKQDKRIRWYNYLNKLNGDRLAAQRWHDFIRNRNKTRKRRSTKRRGPKRRRRVRREISKEENFTYNKLTNMFSDVSTGLDNFFLPQQKKCQQEILPAVSIDHFVRCLRKSTLDPELEEELAGLVGKSFDPQYETTTYPPMNGSVYDDADFPLPTLVDDDGTKYLLSMDFQPLHKEEKLSDFLGADPYFYHDWSPYRYKYNSLSNSQRQPGWSYKGLHGTKEWHQLNLERFLMPMKRTADLQGLEFIPDFAQTYPGIGDLAEGLPNLVTPLESRWTKDSGYNIYTRFLVPLLDEDDLAYFKKKGMIEQSVTVRPDAAVIQDIVDALDKYMNESTDSLVVTDGLGVEPNPKFKTIEDVPYYNEYFRTIQLIFGIDLGLYRSVKMKKWGTDTLNLELDVVRRLFRSYIDAVKVQEACVQAMLERRPSPAEYEHERDHVHVDGGEEELDYVLIDAAVAANKSCITAPNVSEAIKTELNTDPTSQDFYDTRGGYKVTYQNLMLLYEKFFLRKEARRTYSLQKYPVEFPICKGDDPSPIDIITDHGRQSTLKDYSFGQAAYRLNRFFMFYPLDGSTLLTVGIVDGERLDGSSVRLTGGAIRGQNLTFQYMHIHFADKWNVVGSEHRINGKGAQMELQMVFTIAGSADPIKYWNVLARVQNKLFQFREELVIILSVLVDVLETDEAVTEKIESENLNQDPYLFEPFAQAAYHFRKMPKVHPEYEQPRGYVSEDPVFRFIDFIPRKTGRFFTYRGSLSWPPCFGYVMWSVFEERLYMSKRQFDQFSKIPAYGINDYNYAHDNFRDLEDIYVETEHEPTLQHFQVEELKRQRTIDRGILVGHHDVTAEGLETEEKSVVGDEMYFVSSDNGSGGLKCVGRHFGVVMLVLMVVIHM